MHSLYNGPQLSAKENFRLEKMEMWVVRDISGSQLAKSNKRVLVDPEAWILLEIGGWSLHSQGLWEVSDHQ